MKLALETLYQHTTEEGDCMLWNHSLNSDGYPQARIDGDTVNVRQWVFAQTGKTKKAGWCLSTRCGNKDCVNPEHLMQITRSSANVAAYKTGRRNVATERATRRATAAKIGGVWAPKLTIEQAREIRALLSSGITQTELAKRYGVSRSTIGGIWSGKRWKEETFSVFTWAHAA